MAIEIDCFSYLCLLPFSVFILSMLNFSQGSPRSFISLTALNHLRFPGESTLTLFFFLLDIAAIATEKNLPPSVGSKLDSSSLKTIFVFYESFKKNVKIQDRQKKVETRHFHSNLPTFVSCFCFLQKKYIKITTMQTLTRINL